MKLIAHRCNISGPDLSRENNIESALECINKFNYDVELDINADSKFLYLDHDKCSNNKITIKDFKKIFNPYLNKLWLHCKNLNALLLCNDQLYRYNYFGHSNDSFVLTSKKYIFTRPGVMYGKNVVCVMPELDPSINPFNYEIVLTDYPGKYAK